MEGVDFQMMEEKISENMGKLVTNTMRSMMQQSYNDGYTKGIIDGGKKAEQERTLDGVQQVVPKPCVRGIDMRTMKKLLLKLDEEIDEFKFEIMQEMGGLDDGPDDVRQMVEGLEEHVAFRIAEEGADVATIVATICNAIGVDEKTRFEAQAYVNKHNHERGRL